MRDPARERADGFHLLRMEQLCFERAPRDLGPTPLGDIAHEDARHLLARVRQHGDGELEWMTRPVVGDPFDLDAVLAASLAQRDERAPL